MATETTTQLSGPDLADRIDAAIREAEPDHERAQVCLWFGGVADRGEYAGQQCGVDSASVTTHRLGGGVARGGEHLDFQVDFADWSDWSRARRVRKCWRLIDAALAYAAENYAGIDPEPDESFFE